jgi:hypothetical protein
MARTRVVAISLALIALPAGCSTLSGLPDYWNVVAGSAPSQGSTALAELRGFVEPTKEISTTTASGNTHAEKDIELEIHVLSVSTTDAGAFLADRHRNRLVAGRLKACDAQAFVAALQDLYGVELKSRPRLLVSTGEKASLGAGGWGPHLYGGMCSKSFYDPSEALLEGTPVAGPDRDLILDIKFALSRLKLDAVSRERRSVPSGEVDRPETEPTVRDGTRAQLGPGETLVLGGLHHQRRKNGVVFWECWGSSSGVQTESSLFSRLVERCAVGTNRARKQPELIDEEFVVLITPRVADRQRD